MSASLVPVSEAREKIAEIVKASDKDDVVLLRHGRPAAVVMSARRHTDLMELLDDLEDRLSVYEAEGKAIPAEKFWAELGLQ